MNPEAFLAFIQKASERIRSRLPEALPTEEWGGALLKKQELFNEAEEQYRIAAELERSAKR